MFEVYTPRKHCSNGCKIGPAQKTLTASAPVVIQSAPFSEDIPRNSTAAALFSSSACPHEALPVSQEKEKVMAKTVCKLLGLVLSLVGVLGFTHLLDSLGAHVGPAYAAHNAVHIVSGLVALYFGFAGSAGGARGFCFLFGLVYLLLGVAGWFMGTGPDHMFNVGTLLMLGKMDHIIHILLGVVFLAGGALGRSE